MEDVGGKGLSRNPRGPSMGNFLLVRKTLFKFKWPAGFLMFFVLRTRGVRYTGAISSSFNGRRSFRQLYLQWDEYCWQTDKYTASNNPKAARVNSYHSEIDLTNQPTGKWWRRGELNPCYCNPILNLNTPYSADTYKLSGHRQTLAVR
jgi:hypothetical protein